MDPDATEVLHPSARPRPRRPPRLAVAAAPPSTCRRGHDDRARAALGAAWWTHRPPYVEPPVPLSIENAVLDGRDLGGPRIRDDGFLMVAFAGRSTDASARVRRARPRRPRARDHRSAHRRTQPRPTTPRACRPRRSCSAPTPTFLRATSADYGLLVRRTDADGVSEVTRAARARRDPARRRAARALRAGLRRAGALGRRRAARRPGRVVDRVAVARGPQRLEPAGRGRDASAARPAGSTSISRPTSRSRRRARPSCRRGCRCRTARPPVRR